jgi:phosphopantetheinyl transferase
LKRFESIIHPNKRAEFLSSRFALHFLLPDYHLTYSDRRPILLNKGHISISHSRIWAGAIYSTDKRVGLDVEEKRDKIMKIAHKFIRTDEEAFMAEDSEYKCQVIWSAKEAMYKLWKHGNVLFKENLLVHPFEKKKIGMTQAEILMDEHIYCDIHYRDLPSSLLVYAVER